MNSIQNIEMIIEALLFASGDCLPLEKIAEIIENDKKTTKAIMSNLMYKFQNSNRGLIIREIDGAYQLCTRPDLDEYVQNLGTLRKKQGLTPQAYETLAIVAYNQPVTRAYIEQIRGVNSDGVLLTLTDRSLIEEVGRDNTPGKPKLYGTTEEFLRAFGFASIRELPPLEMNEIPEVYENIPLD